MSCCREDTDCLLSWGFSSASGRSDWLDLQKHRGKQHDRKRLLALANTIQRAGRWGREGKSFAVVLQPERCILLQGQTCSGCMCVWVGCVWRGYQGQALVFTGQVSTKRGHNRARRDITEERARAEGRVLKDRFRHRAEKFHSTSIIPSTPRRVRSATDQRGHVGQTRWATSAPRLGYTQAAWWIPESKNLDGADRGEPQQQDWMLLPVMLGGTVTWVALTRSKDLPRFDCWSTLSLFYLFKLHDHKPKSYWGLLGASYYFLFCLLVECRLAVFFLCSWFILVMMCVLL